MAESGSSSSSSSKSPSEFSDKTKETDVRTANILAAKGMS